MEPLEVHPKSGHPERVSGTTQELIHNVFTQFSAVCAAELRLTPVSARTDHVSGCPQAASVQHISFGHLIV